MSGSFQVPHHRNIVHILCDFCQYSDNWSIFVHYPTATSSDRNWVFVQVRYLTFFTALLLKMQLHISFNQTGVTTTDHWRNFQNVLKFHCLEWPALSVVQC